MIQKLFLIFSFLLCASALADELVVVKAISDSRQSFVIGKGFEEGIRVGQKRIFTTDKVSLVARATEVKNTLSLWEIDEKKGTVPFGHEEVVVITSSTEAIWTDINRVKENLKNEVNQKTLSVSDRSAYVLKGSMSRGLAESSDGTATNIQTTRSGFHLEGLYSKELEGRYASKFELSAGLRYDKDSTTMTSDTQFTILTTRLFVIGELTYNFDSSEKLGGNFYATLGGGYGRSSSTLDSTTSAGAAFVLPSVKVGFCSYFESYQVLFEAGLEAISAKESFTDIEDTQKTTLISSKLGLGIRF